MQLLCLSQCAIKMKPSCNISSNSVGQTNWVRKTTSNSLHLCHYHSLYLPLPPFLSSSHFPWKCQGESLFAVIRGSDTFNKPLSQLSPDTLFISGLTRDKHATGGLLTHRTRDIISIGFNQSSVHPFHADHFIICQTQQWRDLLHCRGLWGPVSQDNFQSCLNPIKMLFMLLWKFFMPFTWFRKVELSL